MVKSGAFHYGLILLGIFHVNKVEELLKIAPSAESVRSPRFPVPEVNFSSHSKLNLGKPTLLMLSCETCPQITPAKPELMHGNGLKVSM